MTRAAEVWLLVLAGCVTGCGVFLFVAFQIEREPASIRYRVTALRMQRLAVCLEEQRLATGSYAATLADVSACLEERDENPTDDWGESFRYVPKLPDAYVLSSSGEDRLHTQLVSRNPAKLVTTWPSDSDDIALLSGRWIALDQPVASLPNHTIQAILSNNELEIDVATTGDSDGFYLAARATGTGRWAIGEHQLDAAQGFVVLWRVTPGLEWNGHDAEGSFPIGCPLASETLILQVAEIRGLEVDNRDSMIMIRSRECPLRDDETNSRDPFAPKS